MLYNSCSQSTLIYLLVEFYQPLAGIHLKHSRTTYSSLLMLFHKRNKPMVEKWTTERMNLKFEQQNLCRHQGTYNWCTISLSSTEVLTVLCFFNTQHKDFRGKGPTVRNRRRRILEMMARYLVSLQAELVPI